MRKRCVTYDLIVYLSNKLCSSGEKIYIYTCVRSTCGISVKEDVRNEQQNAVSLFN